MRSSSRRGPPARPTNYKQGGTAQAGVEDVATGTVWTGSVVSQGSPKPLQASKNRNLNHCHPLFRSASGIRLLSESDLATHSLVASRATALRSQRLGLSVRREDSTQHKRRAFIIKERLKGCRLFGFILRTKENIKIQGASLRVKSSVLAIIALPRITKRK